jgi:hypothetical protein
MVLLGCSLLKNHPTVTAEAGHGKRSMQSTRRLVRSQLVARADVAIVVIDEHDKISPWRHGDCS